MAEYYKIYTDGGCKPNPGFGGWAAIIHEYLDGDLKSEIEISGVANQSTNNRMEMTALIKAFEVLTQPSSITVFTDSRYLERGIGAWADGRPTNRGWIYNWQKNGWQKREGKLLNADLWEKIYRKIISHQKIQMKYVPGHSGHVLNERCDKLVKQAMERKNADKI